jgi:hypothetical protein
MAESGIVGRGILLDFHSWREAQSPPIPYDAFKTGSIPHKYLLATAEAQGTEIKFGDILIKISGQLGRSSEFQTGCADANDTTGYMAAYNKKPADEIAALQKVNPPTFSRVEQSEEILKWIWENPSAVAGDQPSFECWRMYPPFPSTKSWDLLLPCSPSNALGPPRSPTRRLGMSHRRTV